MPAPSAPPTAFRPAWVIGTGQAAWTGSQAPKYPPTSSARRGSAGPPASMTSCAEWRAHLDLIDAGPAHRAAHRHEHRAGSGRRSGAAEPAVAITGDQGHVSQGLDVVHQGRVPVHAALVRTRGEKVGLAGPPFRYWTIEDCSLDTYRPGMPVTWIGTASRPAASRFGHRVFQAVQQAVPGPGARTGTPRSRRPPPRRASSRPVPGAGACSAAAGPCGWRALPRRRWPPAPCSPARPRPPASCARPGSPRRPGRSGPRPPRHR